jgi:hypothetical protein
MEVRQNEESGQVAGKKRVVGRRFRKINESAAEHFQKRSGHELKIPENERISS